MTDSDTKTLLDSLMARRGNAPEFILEIEGYVADLANGDLDSADVKYIRDLAKRLGKGGGAPIEPDNEPADEPADEDEKAEEDWHDTRFARAKAAFHERFNPDNLDPDAPDTALRREIYEEFRAELMRIEEEG